MDSDLELDLSSLADQLSDLEDKLDFNFPYEKPYAGKLLIFMK